jgi:hypothetical protein
MNTPIQEALRQVRELQQSILEKQRFKGYSGRARAMAGCGALGAGVLLSSSIIPATVTAHFITWSVVFVVGLVCNYGALVYWFLHDPGVARDVRRLRPALEIAPILLSGGVITLALVHHGEYDLLFGAWMVLYALVNLTARQVLPRGLAWVGLFYLACGSACLLFWPELSFIGNPLVMGGVFFTGEFFGGLVLHYDESPMPSLRAFFGLPSAASLEETE